MTGDAWVGIGLAVFGVGAPLTVAVAKLVRPNGRRDLQPGFGVECEKHREKLLALQLQLGSLADGVVYIKESVGRIEKELDKLKERTK